jgi:uncharacterized protein YcfL
MKLALFTLCLVALLLAVGCSSAPPAPSVPVAITDTKPLGDGIRTLAYAFLGASVVITLGRLLR